MKLWQTIPILLILIGVQIAATLIAIPTKASEVTAFGDPESFSSPFVYLGWVIVVTAIILVMFKLGFRKFLTAFFLLSVWATSSFVTLTMVQQFTDGFNPVANIAALAIPIFFALLIWKFPEWYVIDAIGFIICAGATAIIGVSFGIIPVIILLVIFAIYDAISVYKTKHMLTLAESILTQKLPALFIIPKERGFSYINSHTWTDLDNVTARQTYIIGMGDIIFPSVMVVSASTFLAGPKLFGVFTIPAIGAMVGSWIGLVVLQWYATKHPQTHAGLPFLNTFTIFGFGMMYLAGIVWAI